MNNNKKYLAQHNNTIWQGKDGAYYTHLPDAKRTILRKVSKESLEADIIAYYKAVEDRPTVKDLFYRWITEKLELCEISKGTYDRYENDFKRFFSNSELLEVMVDTLQDDDLEFFIRKTIASQKLSAKAYSGLRTILNGMFKYAKKKKYTEISISTFFKDLDISRKAFTNKPKAKEEQVFSEDEIPQLIEWLLSHPSIEHFGLILAFYTGIRTSELSALKFSDITGNELHIQRQEITYKGNEKYQNIHEVVEYTKTEAGNRYIILPTEAIQIIKKIRKLNPFGEYMIMTNNRRVWKNTFNDRLYSACDSVGIARRSMHKIRKTYGTTLINSGVDEALIMNQMGHADITTTKKYYYFANKNRIHNQEQIENAVKFTVKS
jgi:integrase